MIQPLLIADVADVDHHLDVVAEVDKGAEFRQAGHFALGLAAATLLSPQRQIWTASGFFYAAAAQIAAVLVRLDQAHGFLALIMILLLSAASFALKPATG